MRLGECGPWMGASGVGRGGGGQWRRETTQQAVGFQVRKGEAEVAGHCGKREGMVWKPE